MSILFLLNWKSSNNENRVRKHFDHHVIMFRIHCMYPTFEVTGLRYYGIFQTSIWEPRIWMTMLYSLALCSLTSFDISPYYSNFTPDTNFPKYCSISVGILFCSWLISLHLGTFFKLWQHFSIMCSNDDKTEQTPLESIKAIECPFFSLSWIQGQYINTIKVNLCQWCHFFVYSCSLSRCATVVYCNEKNCK